MHHFLKILNLLHHRYVAWLHKEMLSCIILTDYPLSALYKHLHDISFCIAVSAILSNLYCNKQPLMIFQCHKVSTPRVSKSIPDASVRVSLLKIFYSSCDKKTFLMTKILFLWQELFSCDKNSSLVLRHYCLPLKGNFFLWHTICSCVKNRTKCVIFHQNFLWVFKISWEDSSHLPGEYPTLA